MQPLYFGESTKPLYGVYHEPRENWRNEAVLLLYPVGSEYMRIHRAFVRLANMLADDGFAVFRFDYSGTGDSYGDEQGTSLDAWDGDVIAASEEALAISGAETLSVVAARLGSVLASRLAFKQTIKKMVLWEPVGEGKDYLRQLQDALPGELQDRTSLGDGFNINGFYYSSDLVAGLNAYSFYTCDWSSVTTDTSLLFADQQVLEQFYKQSAINNEKVSALKIDCLANWLELDNLGRIFLPQGVLKDIAGLLVQPASAGESL